MILSLTVPHSSKQNNTNAEFDIMDANGDGVIDRQEWLSSTQQPEAPLTPDEPSCNHNNEISAHPARLPPATPCPSEMGDWSIAPSEAPTPMRFLREESLLEASEEAPVPPDKPDALVESTEAEEVAKNAAEFAEPSEAHRPSRQASNPTRSSRSPLLTSGVLRGSQTLPEVVFPVRLPLQQILAQEAVTCTTSALPEVTPTHPPAHRVFSLCPLDRGRFDHHRPSH